MYLLKNFTIRIVMLAILGLFCLLWSGVGLFSLHALSKISEGNDIVILTRHFRTAFVS